jgi:hypothetical protein
MSWRGTAPVSWIAAGPKAASKPTTPVARMTDRNNGAGTVESRGFIIPASKGLHRSRIAQPSMRMPLIVGHGNGCAMAQTGKSRAFSEVLPVCNGRRQACERPLDGLRSP